MTETRTPTQNNALHLYFELVAEELNNAGYDIQKTITHQLEIPWSKESVKELIWRQAQKTYLGKQSTTELSTKDIDAIYDIVNRYLSQFGITVPFPSNEEAEEEVRNLLEKKVRSSR